MILVAARVVTTRSGGYASSSSADDTKPALSTKKCQLESVKSSVMSKRRKVNQQQQLSASESSHDVLSSRQLDILPVLLDNTRTSSSIASLKRCRGSMTTASKSQQKHSTEGIAFPTIQENITTSSATDSSNAKLAAEVEELKKMVKDLATSNKAFLLESQSAKAQNTVDSDNSRSRRFATVGIQSTRRDIPEKKDIEIPPAAMERSSVPKHAGALSNCSSDEQLSVSTDSSISSPRRPSKRQQRRKEYKRYSAYILISIRLS